MTDEIRWRKRGSTTEFGSAQAPTGCELGKTDSAYLGEHGVGGELGELGRPESDGEDSLGRDPVGVHGREGGGRLLSLLGLEGSDENTVRREQVGDGGSLGEELGIG